LPKRQSLTHSHPGGHPQYSCTGQAQPAQCSCIVYVLLAPTCARRHPHPAAAAAGRTASAGLSAATGRSRRPQAPGESRPAVPVITRRNLKLYPRHSDDCVCTCRGEKRGGQLQPQASSENALSAQAICQKRSINHRQLTGWLSTWGQAGVIISGILGSLRGRLIEYLPEWRSTTLPADRATGVYLLRGNILLMSCKPFDSPLLSTSMTYAYSGISTALRRARPPPRSPGPSRAASCPCRQSSGRAAPRRRGS
jgi:hypothetical protein